MRNSFVNGLLQFQKKFGIIVSKTYHVGRQSIGVYIDRLMAMKLFFQGRNLVQMTHYARFKSHNLLLKARVFFLERRIERMERRIAVLEQGHFDRFPTHKIWASLNANATVKPPDASAASGRSA